MAEDLIEVAKLTKPLVNVMGRSVRLSDTATSASDSEGTVRHQKHASVMNNTKWRELRLGILESRAKPSFRGKNLGSDVIGRWDREWYYHFDEGGHEATEWYEIKADSDEEQRAVEEVLRKYQIPVEIRDGIYRIYGYANDTSKIIVLK